MSKIVECPNCGMEIEGDEKICPLCGFEFEETVCEDDEPIEESVPETEPVPKSKAENKSKVMAAVVILVLIIGAIAVFIAIKLFGENGNRNTNIPQNPVTYESTTDESTTETSTTTAEETTTSADITTTTVTTTQTETEAVSTETETGTQQTTESVKVNTVNNDLSTYNGGVEYPRIRAFVRQEGKNFNIRIRWSSGATSYAEYICSGNIDGGNGWTGDMTVLTVEYVDNTVSCDVYAIESHTLRFYPENNLIMWDDIALTKESDDAEFIIGTVNTKESELNVRSNTSTESEIIGTLNKGAVVPIIDDLGDWYLILYNGRVGVVSSKFITVN